MSAVAPGPRRRRRPLSRVAAVLAALGLVLSGLIAAGTGVTEARWNDSEYQRAVFTAAVQPPLNVTCTVQNGIPNQFILNWTASTQPRPPASTYRFEHRVITAAAPNPTWVSTTATTYTYPIPVLGVGTYTIELRAVVTAGGTDRTSATVTRTGVVPALGAITCT